MALSTNPWLSFSVVPVTSAMASGFCLFHGGFLLRGIKQEREQRTNGWNTRGSFNFLRLIGVRCTQV